MGQFVPPAPPAPRDDVLRVRMSETERNQLRALAKAAGMTESAYVRHLIDTLTIDRVFEAMVQVEIRRLLARRPTHEATAPCP